MSEIKRRRADRLTRRISSKSRPMAGNYLQTQRTNLTVIVISIIFAVFLCVYIRSYFYSHQLNIFQKSHLPKALLDQIFDEKNWGTFRPHLYFGLKTKQEHSPLFGLLWYKQPQEQFFQNIVSRHWCDHADNVKYGWEAHNGCTFGRQKIEDDDLLFNTNWMARGQQSWATQITGNSGGNSSYAIVLYFALQKSFDNNGTEEFEDGAIKALNRLKSDGLTYEFISGNSRSIGPFKMQLRFYDALNGKKLSSVSYHRPPTLGIVHAKELILGSLARSAKDLILHQNERIVAAAGSPLNDGSIDFAAVQITVSGKFDFIVELDANGDEFEPISFKEFDKEFSIKMAQFEQKFEKAFPVDFNNKNNNGKEDSLNENKSLYLEMARNALANLLGGIGVWHGFSLVRVPGTMTGEAQPYGPLSLMSAVPSRPYFPRGFLWDEGFHNLLIRRFDPKLSLQILATWLDIMNAEGWIPREVVLDDEARARIPPAFLVQKPEAANPPMFFYLLDKFTRNSEMFKQNQKQISALYPRLKGWYIWLRDKQRGPLTGTMQWQDRNSTTAREVNPVTLSSGLDDYPRASHPSRDEYHLDLRCWLALSSKILRQLAEIFGDSEWVPVVEKDVKEFGDITSLDKRHWSEKKQQYADFGLHSYKIKTEPVMIEGVQQNEHHRVIVEEPRLRLVDDVFGYVNLFPFFFRLLPSDNPKLGIMIRSLNRSDHLWTPFGLRSLSKSSPYYMVKNTPFDIPYWRAPIWINMNYFALDALNYYSKADGPFAQMAAELYSQLRSNLLHNIASQYVKTGFFWENYNDTTGGGLGTHPFTGWTTLVVNILAEAYD